MAITDPFQITYGSRSVGGSSGTYLLHGPYVIEVNFERLRLTFDVIVTAASSGALKTACENLEDDFRKRLVHDETLVIQLASGQTFTYTTGTDFLNVTASAAKTGNPETDRGLSRSYTCTVEGELPADGTNDAGLRDVNVAVTFERGRQKSVTFRGTYTATSAGDAVARYQADFDAEATKYLSDIDNTATFELVDENYTMDRNRDDSDEPYPHTCEFFRQYTELLYNQSGSALDDTQIKDARIVFTDLSQNPGDSKPKIRRLRRVVAQYDAAADIEQTTDLQTLVTGKVIPYIKAQFRSEFSPQVQAIEDQRISYDETNKTLSVQVQFIYQSYGAQPIVEIRQSLTYREIRNVEYTPVHGGGELDAYADPGWMDVERIWTRTVIAIGQGFPRQRLADIQGKGKKQKQDPAGQFTDKIGNDDGPDARDGKRVYQEGWNMISSTSQYTPVFIGITGGSNDTQIIHMVLDETVLERYNKAPSGTATSPVTTPGAG